MTRSKRMEPVQRLSEERADAAAKVFGQARDRLAEQCTRLDQLKGFREDYQNQRARQGQAGVDGFRLRDYNAFIARLDAAIVQQLLTVREAEAEVERTRLQWMEVLGRARAIDKVVDRFQNEERREEDRKDQRRNDELAQRPKSPT